MLVRLCRGYIGNSGVDVNVVGGTCRQTHTHQQQSTQTSVDTLTKATFVAQLVANILTNIVTYIVVDMSPNVARDVYTVFSTCRVTSLSGVDAP